MILITDANKTVFNRQRYCLASFRRVLKPLAFAIYFMKFVRVINTMIQVVLAST